MLPWKRLTQMRVHKCMYERFKKKEAVVTIPLAIIQRLNTTRYQFYQHPINSLLSQYKTICIPMTATRQSYFSIFWSDSMRSQWDGINPRPKICQRCAKTSVYNIWRIRFTFFETQRNNSSSFKRNGKHEPKCLFKLLWIRRKCFKWISLLLV